MRLGKPVTPGDVRKALPRPYQRPQAELSQLLDGLAEARALFAVPSGKGRRYLDRDPEQVVRDVIVAALQGGPLAKPDLTKRVKAAAPGLDKGFAAALAALLASGAVHEHPKAGKTSARVALFPPPPPPDPEQVVRDVIVAALQEGPLAKPDLTKRVKAAAPGLDKRFGAALAALLASGAVHEHPKIGKTSARYALSPPDPGPYLDGAVAQVQAVLALLSPHGVSLAAIHEALGRRLGVLAGAARARSDDEAVLEAVRELAAREPPGALLSVPAVRAALSLDKARFDRAALRLSEAGVVVLLHHDFPQSLPAEERAALVLDDHGTHYNGIALKRRGA